AGRHPGHLAAAAAEQGHVGMPALRQAHARQAHGPRVGPARARLPPLWRAAGGGGMTNRLRERYQAEVVPTLAKQFNYANPMQVPRLQKIVVNIGLGEALTNAKAIDAATGDLA